MLIVVNVLRGALIGVAEVIPGVSGGTVALIVGLYRRFVDAGADIVLAGRRLLTGPRSGAWPLVRGLPWGMLLPVAVGMGAAVIIGARVIEPLLETQPVAMRALFFGLVAAGISVPWMILRRARTGGITWRQWGLILLAAFAAAWLTGLPPGEVIDPPLPVVFLAAAAAVCALALPGVSGSFLLLSIGLYEPTIAAVNDLNFGYLAVFALGAIAGLAAFVSVLRWLLERHVRLTMAIIIGLMAGSLRALWPWQDDNRMLLEPSSDVLLAVGLACIGALIVAGLLWGERRLHLTEEEAELGAPVGGAATR